MRRACRSSLAATIGLVLLAATLLCPIMAVAAAAPAAAGCHERPESHDHDGALGSVICCAGVKAATPPQPTHDDGSAVPFGLGSEPDILPLVRPGCLPPRSLGVPPLLFVQHAVLRI